MGHTYPRADLASTRGDMCSDLAQTGSRAAAAAACVGHTYPRADLASTDGNMCADLLRTRSPAAVAAACEEYTYPRADLAVRDGSMDALSACCVGTCSGPRGADVTSGC